MQLVLRDNELVALPKEIGDLIRLRELHIQGNRLTVLPPEFGGLHHHECRQSLLSILFTYSWCQYQ